MAFDKAKIFQAAEKAVLKGQYDKALESFEQILKVDPLDSKALNRVADLYLKQNDVAKGVAALSKLGESYTADGFFSKAVAIYKRILKIDNAGTKESLVGVHEKLAELYGQLGLVSDAMAHFAIVVDVHDRAGDQEALLNALKKVSDLDPYNIDSQLKLAELLLAQNRADEATESLTRLAEHVNAKGHLPDVLRVYERWVELFPSDFKKLQELVDQYLRVGEPKKALARIQVAFKSNPRDPQILELLSQTFIGLKQPEKSKAVDVELIKIYRQAGATADAQRIEDRIRGKVPDFSKSETVTKQAQVAEQDQIDPADSLIQATPLDPDERKIISECEVYVKYGLAEKAIDAFQKAIAKFSQSLVLRWKLKNVLLEASQNEAAVHTLSEILMLAKTKNLSAWKDVAEKELSNLDPHHPALGGGAKAAAAKKLEVAAAPAIETRSDTTSVENIDFQDFEQSEISIVLDDEVVPAEPEKLDVTKDSGPVSDSLELIEDSAEIELSPAVEISSVSGPMVMELPEDPPMAIDMVEEESTGDGAEALLSESDFSDEELQKLDSNFSPESEPANSKPAAAPTPKSAPKPAPAPEAIVDADFEIRQALEEVEFFRAQGLDGEANQLIQSLNARYPNHPLLSKAAPGSGPTEGAKSKGDPSKLKKATLELETLGRKIKLNVQEDERSAEDDNFFDLAAELSNELGGEEESKAFGGPTEVREVFNAFKAGVSKVVGEDDWQTHFDLGVAYREMGLIDDAIVEFGIVAKNKSQEAGALYQMGICEVAREKFDAARDYFDKALKHPSLAGQEKLSITYELAEALLKLDDKKKARQLYQEVMKLDPEFRDVKDRLKALA